MVKTIFLIKQQENVKKAYVNIHKVAFFILNSSHQTVMNCDVPNKHALNFRKKISYKKLLVESTFSINTKQS